MRILTQDNVVTINSSPLKGTFRILGIGREAVILVTDIVTAAPLMLNGFSIGNKKYISIFYNLSENQLQFVGDHGERKVLHKDIRNRLLLSSHAPLKWIPEPHAPLTMFTAFISPSLLRAIAGSSLNARKAVLNLSTINGQGYMDLSISQEAVKLIHSIIQCSGSNPWEIAYIKGLTYKLLLSLVEDSRRGPLPQGMKSVEFDKIMQVRQRLLKDLSQAPPKLEVLAKMSLMSKSKFQSLFKKVYGMSYYQYYKCKKLEKAKYMLSTGKYSVSEVAYYIGYSNLGYFSRAFKRMFNVLPKAIRIDNMEYHDTANNVLLE